MTLPFCFPEPPATVTGPHRFAERVLVFPFVRLRPMSVLRALLVFALVGPMASAAELKTLKGESRKGELVSISDKEIVLEVDGKKVSTPIDQVLHLNLKDGFEKIEGDTKYAEVELTDGTLLKCSKVELIESDAKLALLGGPEVKLPLAKISSILNAASVSKTDEGFSVTTSAGVTITYAAEKVARLDYSKGKLEFLSRMAPASVKESSTEGKVVSFTRDRNFDDAKIRLAGVDYNQG